MLRSITCRVLFSSLILFASGAFCRGDSAAPRHLDLQPDSSLSLVGDSTLHPFTSKTSQLQVTAEVDPSAGEPIPAILEKQALKRFDLSVPVKSLKSKESGLDKNMYKALNAEHCPAIDFHMKSYTIGTSTPASVKAAGTLNIACQEQPVTLEGTLTPESNTLHVQGTYSLLMTDYGVKPPTMMLGTIKVKDKVVIHYDLRLAPNSMKGGGE